MNKKTALFLLLSLSFVQAHSAEEIAPESAYPNKAEIVEKINSSKSNAEKMKVIYNSGKPLKIMNYLTGEKDELNKPGSLTEEEGAQYVPQTEEFINLYLDFLAEGKLPVEAIVSTHVSPEATKILKEYKLKSINSK